ncbi:ubiquitin carboxyl-terminal hydrolase, putative [Pediculus humanus corporis]|uniref:Ubiquitin carboxyl-terminal hydrolase n=1 Tax=Pediculus humanus subsp. corporis TaxID=121224 RepID=E0VXR2_PEDHC|nr:ubiquitin carboxyl-terminal hydrolase, putative [Pediculus humanus corporis]EEB18168.1 ubiquitin carboxyl-terminal hydrolase, putative [Pediculus humanus corporis]
MSEYEACQHALTSASYSQVELARLKGLGRCGYCNFHGRNLWLCLEKDCGRVLCGDAESDHSTFHFKTNKTHYIHQNLSSLRLWCYLCKTEAFLGSQTPNAVRTWSEDYSDSETKETFVNDKKPKGLQNIGNTCYMNAALQALCNTTPLSQYFLQCLVLASNQEKLTLSKNFQRLNKEMWQRNSPGCIVPSGILYGIRNIHPMFRGYQQHDTQEFLRCFMDQLHEELKEPIRDSNNYRVTSANLPNEVVTDYSDDEEGNKGDDAKQENVTEGGASSGSQSEAEYETCDSGVSERSSLSDEGERKSVKRKHSHSSSPPSRCRLSSRLYSSYRQTSQQNSPVKSKKKPVKYRSIISDLFDGKLLSSVQCLTCNKISTRVETFQDLSLPIPSRDHVTMLHQGSISPQSMTTCSETYKGKPSWVSWLWEWMKSWFWGPTVSLHDCLAAFFSADELKGDNMYSCEKCSKLRNGVKYSKVLDLPEVLCIHLKRFRHELAFSSKINSFVNFPLTGLNMRPYLHKDCKSEVTSYDLTSVICHHGTANGGHYTCYALSPFTGEWYELDDQCVTQVAPETVSNVECYVLFYKKSNEKMEKIRNKVRELISYKNKEPSLMEFYVSKQWINKLNTFAEPGPIDNSDFLCVHGGVHPSKVPIVDKLSTVLSQNVWEYLYAIFGGGPVCNRLYICGACQQKQEALRQRKQYELCRYLALHHEFQQGESTPVIYGLSMQWFGQWQAFVQNTSAEPPGPIDNSPIITNVNGQKTLKRDANYGQVSQELWNFFKSVYGGGPELVIKQSQRVTSRNSFSSGISTDRELGLIQPGKAKSVDSLPINSNHSNSLYSLYNTRSSRAQSASSDNIALKMAAVNAAISHRKQQSLGSLKIERNAHTDDEILGISENQRTENKEEGEEINFQDNYSPLEGDSDELDEYSYCPAFTPDELDAYIPFRKFNN